MTDIAEFVYGIVSRKPHDVDIVIYLQSRARWGLKVTWSQAGAGPQFTKCYTFEVLRDANFDVGAYGRSETSFAISKLRATASDQS